MRKEILKIARAGLAVASLAGAVSGAFAAPMVNLDGVGYVLYGDAQSYSLPAAIVEKCDGHAPGCQYNVDSSPGQIKDLIVVATGASGGPVNTNSDGMDNAYQTPNSDGKIFFRPTGGGGPGHNNYTIETSGSVANNRTDTWDASLAAMKSFLSGNQMVFFLNNNQTKSGSTANESLAAWAQVWLTDGSNNIVGDVYQATNRKSPYNVFTDGGGGTPLGDPTTYTNTTLGNPVAGTNSETDYILSGGKICYLTGGIPVPCSTPHDYEVDHNLGANQAAYALMFPELNALMKSLFAGGGDLTNYTLHVDVRLGCDPGITGGDITTICESTPYGRSLNNGYEQIFIGTAVDSSVPEPGSMALAGLALGAMAWRVRRRKEA